MAIFNFARRARKLRYYGDVIHPSYISRRTRWWCLKCVKVYPPRDIRPFVMYCVNGKPRSSLLIESTDSMISGCIYTSLAVFIYLWLYLYISGCIYISLAVVYRLYDIRLHLYISGCVYISLAVFIYFWLYLYISGCTYISPVLLNFDTNGAPYGCTYNYMSGFTEF